MSKSANLKEVSEVLNDISWKILSMLEEAGGHMPFKQIKENLKLSPEKITKELILLEGGVLVKSERSKTDTRFKDYYLTEYGKAIQEYKPN